MSIIGIVDENHKLELVLKIQSGMNELGTRKVLINIIEGTESIRIPLNP